ncbi:TfoX/Sxy family DNA transformation protein [Actinobacillus pleuropneumoniae]
MAISPKKFQYLKEIFSPLGEINFKSYFSYLGRFKDDTMFALYDHKNDRLYLRKSAQFYPDIIRTIPIHFLIDRRIGKQQSHIFYLIPSSIIHNLHLYTHWILSAIEEYQTAKAKLISQNKNKIRLLPNLNINIERLLARIEIYTVDDLKNVGVINAFVKLIMLGLEVTELLLFKLYAALEHKYIYMLSKQEKQSLLIEADLSLYNAGLRKRFAISQAN